jgi:predicted dienelactone hydrolase
MKLKRGLNSASFLFICASVAAQQYSIGHTSAELRDTQRGNRKVPIEVYYPEAPVVSDSCRDDVNTSRFPVICFAHGYLLSGKSYQHLVDMLVPEGYIMVCLNSGDALFPSHRRFGEDLRFVSEELGRFDSDRASPLFGRVDTLRCLMGHSMGGGATFLAAADNRSVHAVVTLSPANTRPSAFDAASATEVPTLIFSGTNDCITPPEEHHLPMYEKSSSPDKSYLLIHGGTHCQMGVSFEKCVIGEKMARCIAGISEEQQLTILARYMVPWLKYFFNGEKEAGIRFDAELRSDTTVTWFQSRRLVSTSDQ